MMKATAIPVRTTDPPKAVASGWETILIDQASMTSSVVSTPNQKSSRCHRSVMLLRSDEAAASGIRPGNIPVGELCPSKRERGDAWLEGTGDSESMPPVE